jgi:arabinofuranan 3-O-arabinosyltransferase
MTEAGMAEVTSQSPHAVGREASPDYSPIQAMRRIGIAWRSPVSIVLAAAVWLLDIRDWTGLYRLAEQQVSPLGSDLKISWLAAKAFLDGGYPYAIANQYPPSNLLFSWPLGLFHFESVLHPLLAVSIVLLVVSVMMSAAAVGRRWWGLSAATGVWLLCRGNPTVSVLILLNASILAAFALALSFLFLSRARWTAAAVVLGLSFCIKPLLLPVLIVFLFARRWRSLAVALGIPLVLNLIALAVVPHVDQVWSRLSYLVSGGGAAFYPMNAALTGVGAVHGWSAFLTMSLRAMVAALAAVVSWLAWCRLPTPPLRVITSGSAALLGVFLSGSLAENHYMLMFVPLAMTVAARRSAVRIPMAWIGVAMILILSPLPSSWLGVPNAIETNSTMEALGMALVLVTMTLDLAYREPRRRQVSGQRASQNGSMAGR